MRANAIKRNQSHPGDRGRELASAIHLGLIPLSWFNSDAWRPSLKVANRRVADVGKRAMSGDDATAG
jgi:hypothetical protein